jgi:hypothetical protein
LNAASRICSRRVRLLSACVGGRRSLAIASVCLPSLAAPSRRKPTDRSVG